MIKGQPQLPPVVKVVLVNVPLKVTMPLSLRRHKSLRYISSFRTTTPVTSLCSQSNHSLSV